MERWVKPGFAVIGLEGATTEGEGLVQRLWAEANRRFGEVAALAKTNADGSLAGVWGAMTDMSRAFRPWEDGFTRGLYLAGVECRDDAMYITTLYEDAPVKVEYSAVLAERCINCKSKKHVAYDELMGEDGEVIDSARFDQVAELEAMTADERFAFWQNELSRCIRCNACRDACPACTCEKCVFDNPNSGVENKAPANSFEEQMFHIIRAFHVAGRCTDCGECSRVCPQNIPLHLLNRKFIKDINEFYGEYQAGETEGSRAPLVNYTVGDVEPGEVFDRRDD